ncbi:hypothetical protein ABFA07_019622 [Porites harrisoni]
MDSWVVCGTTVPASNSNMVLFGGDRQVTDDFQALLRTLAAPCPLQLHPYSGHVVDQVATISRGIPVLAVLWNDHSQGSVRLFAENADLCELANSQTSVWPLKRQSHDYQILERLLPGERIDASLALLLTKVGSVFKVLLNLTSRDNLNDAAVVDQFKSSLADFSERRANC